MKLTILSFGFTKDIIGQRFTEIELPDGSNISQLRKLLFEKFPALSKMASIRMAVNSEYADDSSVLNDNDEVALIPPVSGG